MRKLSSYFLMLFLSVAILGFSACDDDDGGNEPGTEEMTIAEIVADDANFSTLLAALQQVNLDGTLAQTGPFTVFAPTNQAFANAGIDLATISDEALTEVLLYHVFAGQGIMASEIAEGQTYLQTASENGPDNELLSLLVERDGSTVTLNGSINVTQADIIARNGVIHVIGEVLMPLDVVGHAAANSNFSTLVSALGSADGELVSVLQGDGPWTVFAPGNAAFAAIQETVDGLTTAQLAQVLLYHVSPGNITSNEVAAGAIPTANEGTDFEATSLDPLQVTDDQGNVVNIVFTDVQGTNGVIHVLDAVLIPDGL